MTIVKSVSCVKNKNAFKQWMFLRWQQAARHTEVTCSYMLIHWSKITARFFTDPLGIIENAPMCNAGVHVCSLNIPVSPYAVSVIFHSALLYLSYDISFSIGLVIENQIICNLYTCSGYFSKVGTHILQIYLQILLF